METHTNLSYSSVLLYWISQNFGINVMIAEKSYQWVTQ